jgi:hypothetical protein
MKLQIWSFSEKDIEIFPFLYETSETEAKDERVQKYFFSDLRITKEFSSTLRQTTVKL